MTALLDTNNPLIILACIAFMVLRATVTTTARVIVAIATHTARFFAAHGRIMALCLLIVVAIPATVLIANALIPVIVAVAGKALAGAGGTMAFAFFFRP
jgi:ABC-type iron transport system FetAB permease component